MHYSTNTMLGGAIVVIICFVCTEKTKRALDALVESGQYNDYAEVIASAVDNLLVLQKEVIKKGAIVITGMDSSDLDGSHFGSTVKLDMISTAKMTNGVKEMKKHLRRKETSIIPTIFLLNGITESPEHVAEPPSDLWMMSDMVPLDRWVFGQFNRFLPAKASCRAVAHLLNNAPNGVPLSQAASKISEEAAALGDFLAAYDKRNAVGRDEAFSTAFPSTTDNAEKGRLRYANQFVASVNREGKVSGLLTDLKLINHSQGESPLLLLTEMGWRFALLANPVLDGGQEKPIRKFSTEETDLLLDHITRSVPTEAFAYRTILTAITEGADTPEKIDTILQKQVSQDRSRNLTASFLSSQRSGAVSRMADLGLVARIRDGVRVFYIATDAGKKFVQSSSAQQSA